MTTSMSGGGGSIVSASLQETLAGNAKTKVECLHDAGSAIYLMQTFGC